MIKLRQEVSVYLENLSDILNTLAFGAAAISPIAIDAYTSSKLSMVIEILYIIYI